MADIKGSSLATGLQAYWDMEEASGTRYDLAGSKNLTDNNTVGQTTGKIGNASLLASASSEYFTATDGTTTRIDDGWSISFWWKPTSLTNYQVLWAQRSGENGFRFYSDSTGALTIGAGSGSFTNASPSTLTLTSGAWNHVVIYCNGANTKLYINNSSPETINIPAITPPNSTLYFGIDYNGTSYPSNGAYEEVGIWNRELTASDVATLYNSGNGLPYYDPTDIKDDATLSTSLVSYWKLDETSGTRNDSHGTNHLTDNNTVLYATGKIGSGADFEKDNNERLSILDASQTGLDFSTDFSFSCWIKLETLPASGDAPTILGKFDLGVGGQYGIGYWNNAGTYYWRSTVYDSTTPTENLSTNIGSAITLSTATWYHVVWTFDETNYTSYLYINGVLHGTGVHTGYSGTLNNSAGKFLVGQYYETGGGYYFDGLIDELSAWSKRLSLAEVRALYGYGTPPEYDVVTGGGFTPTPMMHMMAVTGGLL